MYRIALRNNTTGEFRIISCDSEWDENEELLWTIGSFSCDCNRVLFFARANNKPDPEDLHCGESEFSAFIELIERRI